MEEYPVIVIDNGTTTTKSGYAGDDSPRSCIPMVVARSKDKNSTQNAYVGDWALGKKNMHFSHPMEKGLITNWDDMERIWNEIFFIELRVDPEENRILLTESLFNPKQKREKTTEIMFETFKTPAVYLIPSHCLSLYNLGRETGTVIDMGSMSSCCCIIDGKIDRNSIKKLDVGGKEVTNFLQELLERKGYSLSNKIERVNVREIKEKLSFCLTNNEQKMSSIEEIIKESGINSDEKYHQNYQLPDKQNLAIGKERFLSTELFFRSKIETLQLSGLVENKGNEKDKIMINQKGYDKLEQKKVVVENENQIESSDFNSSSLPNMIYKSILNCSSKEKEKTQKEMFKNIVISGGSSMFEGLQERLTHELNLFWAENAPEIKVIAPPERKFLAWVGGSILSELNKLQNKWFTKAEYNENGSSYVNIKCNDFL
ncbi:actin-10-related [Anaeramoeba flamelloides]|uniref:Actin-10-related n=1 Tax=Anaeramoeba flamelloides TaxID=1746091 RepID=A0AAV7ZPE5_9EUKA|nr:actin-10-related [Anaeramoeba flamelloides]